MYHVKTLSINIFSKMGLILLLENSTSMYIFKREEKNDSLETFHVTKSQVSSVTEKNDTQYLTNTIWSFTPATDSPPPPSPNNDK